MDNFVELSHWVILAFMFRSSRVQSTSCLFVCPCRFQAVRDICFYISSYRGRHFKIEDIQHRVSFGLWSSAPSPPISMFTGRVKCPMACTYMLPHQTDTTLRSGEGGSRPRADVSHMKSVPSARAPPIKQRRPQIDIFPRIVWGWELFIPPTVGTLSFGIAIS